MSMLLKSLELNCFRSLLSFRHTGEGGYPPLSEAKAATWTPDQVRGDNLNVCGLTLENDPQARLMSDG